jgi:hypothetical protein
MSCPLTQGADDTGCKTGPAGIKRVLLTEIVNKNTQTIAAGVITAMALDAAKVFRAYVLRKEKGFYTDTPTYDPANGTYSYAQSLEFTLDEASTSIRQEIHLLLQNTLVAIVERNDGTYICLGYNNGLDLISAPHGSGSKFEDSKGVKLTFTSKDSVPAYEVSSGIIAGLL